MNFFKSHVDELIKTSIAVFKDCSLKNGAIVASNSKKSYFPKESKNYRFVWIRDASYVCIAAKIVGIDIQERFFDWCKKAEGWKETSLFYEKYNVNGKKALYNFQPDQTGTLLIAIWDYFKDGSKKFIGFEDLIKGAADGICEIWEEDHFKLVAQDLWEERYCFPDFKENFTYSIGACSRGLECAYELIPDSRWLEVSYQMKKKLFEQTGDFYFRTFGLLEDKRIDASLLGLVFPFRIVEADDEKMINTVRLIEAIIVRNSGVFRYENDEYDGWMYDGKIKRNKGAGYWPLLNFWMTIYYLELGEIRKAESYFEKVLIDLKGRYFIPEQIFENDYQVSVSPLAWSHAMFIIACHKMGYL